MNCIVCQKDFTAKRRQQVTCSPRCRKQAIKHQLVATNEEKNSVAREKAIATNRHRYGVDWPQQRHEQIEAVKRTNIQRYGHVCQLHSIFFIDEVRRAWNGPSPRCMPGVDEKIMATCIKKYGVTSFWRSRESELARTSQAALAKRYETLKRAGLLRSSRIENECHEDLQRIFDVVERQVTVNRWPIDFYVPSIETYVQFDGDFWHGLDRPRQEIAASRKKIDQVIYRKMLTDESQNEWFLQNDMKLIRVVESSYRAAKDRVCFLRELLRC